MWGVVLTACFDFTFFFFLFPLSKLVHALLCTKNTGCDTVRHRSAREKAEATMEQTIKDVCSLYTEVLHNTQPTCHTF